MEWKKKGVVYLPGQEYEWNQSHAQVPVVDKLNERVWRIYYATRDKSNKSRTSFVDVRAGRPQEIIYEHGTPILELGRLGSFDDSGIMPAWLVNHGGRKYLYYIGWTTRGTVPYHNSIGLAVSDDGGTTFRRMFEGPIVTVTHKEPYFTGTCCVIVDEEDRWKMWYLSCTKWELIDGRPEPFYHIKYAESADGIEWIRNGHVAIDYETREEGGIVSASVMKEDGMYKMWYSYRKAAGYRGNKDQSYRIGYAESSDGKTWKRMDEYVGIDCSREGWDSDMITYPHVVSQEGRKFLFYNGNGFGKSGFGYAIL